jgi:hypothetical protein
MSTKTNNKQKKKKKLNRQLKKIKERSKPGQTKLLKKFEGSGKMKFIDPPDGIKMSAVILKLADPLLKKYGDNDNRIETIISLTVIEWNKLILPEDEQKKIHNITIDHLVPTGADAEDFGSLLYISELIAERKKKYFPHLKKIILNYDLSVSNGNITLNVSSVPIEK